MAPRKIILVLSAAGLEHLVAMSGPSPASEVEIESRDGVLSIVLNRPARKNSLNPVAVRAIVAALEAAATEDSLRVISIAGRGPDFCSGADWIASNSGANRGLEPAVCNAGRLSRLTG